MLRQASSLNHRAMALLNRSNGKLKSTLPESLDLAKLSFSRSSTTGTMQYVLGALYGDHVRRHDTEPLPTGRSNQSLFMNINNKSQSGQSGPDMLR
ncbi:hypothetical protein PR202_gb10829 [Eleusine coracana subsp. coracana]|uniref:Uncharacterized protein n=1 Tax=Eleusine coracana subsp. coracana TaxID=191504 RepID=A0AAV5EKZ9_ELECO|nr:hypothetical protein PR202_gb10829 [Eleusine coracana subsp. coracana]